MEQYLKLVAFLGALGVVAAYSAGAPPEVCTDMVPKHPAEPRKDAIPYSLKTSKGDAVAGDKISITISGNNGKVFKGFLLQARTGNDIVGEFIVEDTHKYIKSIDCGAGKKNAVTHKNSEDKKEITVDWVAPSGHSGPVDFYITVVESGLVFWAKEKTSSVTLG